MQVAATTPQAVRSLLAISSGVAKLLAVIALGKGMLDSLRLTFHRDVTECGDFTKLLGILPFWERLSGIGVGFWGLRQWTDEWKASV